MPAASSAGTGSLAVGVGRATLSGVRLGQGGRPQVAFLHAAIADHRSWSSLLRLLAPDMDVVAYDQRGFGATTYEAEGHDQVVDLLAVLDACDYERPVLVGNSRGGKIALDFALTHPDRVAALVLLAPAVSGAPTVAESDLRPEEAAFWQELEAAEAAGDLDALNRGEIRLWLDGLDGLDAPEGRVTGVARQLALDMNAIALSATSPGHEPRVVDVWSRVGEIACPVLVLVGDLDMSHLQTRCHDLASRIPGAQLRVIPDAAHLPALEQPDVVADMVRAFLGRPA
jgi:pimeloyl-ACP methyl ester carboxylesterase